MKKAIFSLFLFFIINYLFSQDFTKTIEVMNIRMYGLDVMNLQTKLSEHGFNEIGEIDGYYGPLTENVIKRIQYFVGFEQNGKVEKKLWDFLFDISNNEILKNISTLLKIDISEYNKVSGSRMGYSNEGGSIEKYYLDNEIKRIILIIYGETFQVRYYLYYMDINNYFIIEENLRYPFPIYYLLLDPNKMDEIELERNAYELEIIANDEFDFKTEYNYKSYLIKYNELFEIKEGEYLNTNFDLDHLLKVIEDDKANW